MAAVDAGNNGSSSDSNGYIYISTDSGVTWTQQTSAGQHYWSAITSSSDGKNLVAVNNNFSQPGSIYTASFQDVYGEFIWTEQTGVKPFVWSAITSSGDGKKLAATAGNIDSVGPIYTGVFS